MTKDTANATVYYADYYKHWYSEPAALSKYRARTTDRGYITTEVLESARPGGGHWLPVFSKEEMSRHGSYDHAFKDPVKALEWAEADVLEELKKVEDLAGILRTKLAQIAKLKLKYRR